MVSFENPLAVTRSLAIACMVSLVSALTLSSGAHAQYYGNDDDQYYDRGDDQSYGPRYDDRSSSDDYYRTGYDDQDAPDVSRFYNELSDDGRWISHPDYGYVWSPYRVDDDWRPYTRGSWTYTDDYGWYWVSDEPWGWATYHYGRWFYDDRDGWLWVPGTTWGPAWVAWRSSDDYLGWAPLPPDAYWNNGSGLRYDASIYESPRFAFHWSFVEPRYFTTASVYRYCAPRHRARTIIYNTRPQTDYAYLNARIVNRGISLNYVERRLGAPIARSRIFATESRRARGFDRRAGDTIRTWRPDFKRREQWKQRDASITAPPHGRWRDVDRPAVQPRLPRTAVPAPPAPVGQNPSWGGQPIPRIVGVPNTPYTVPNSNRPPPTAALPPVRPQRPAGFSTDRNRWQQGDRDRPDRDHSDRERPDRERGGNDGPNGPRALAAPPATQPPANPPRVIEPTATPSVGRPTAPRNWSGRSDGQRAAAQPSPQPPVSSPRVTEPPARRGWDKGPAEERSRERQENPRVQRERPQPPAAGRPPVVPAPVQQVAPDRLPAARNAIRKPPPEETAPPPDAATAPPPAVVTERQATPRPAPQKPRNLRFDSGR